MSEDIFGTKPEVGELLQQVSGQLKSSLGNIHSALQKLVPPDLRDGDEGMDANAAVLCQSYYRILRLAGNLSDAVSLDGPGGARLQNDDIVGFCRTVMEKAEVPAELLGLRTAFLCEKKSHIIAMDADRLERLLLNLLSNAFKFTPRGGSVTLEVRVLPERVELRLTDTGVGIAPELMDTVFDRYCHARRMDPPPHGLGLGLPICRRIAQEHGGGLVLTSQVGKGTTVTVSLENKKAKVQELRTFVVDYAGGFNHVLVELSDALPKEAFTQKFLD